MGRKKKKDRVSAALLAILLGGFGVHRFYLGQVGLGIVYFFLFPLAVIVSFIDGIIFLAQDDEKFDFKYNRHYIDVAYRNEYDNTDFDRRRLEEKRRKEESQRRADYRTKERKRRKEPNYSRIKKAQPDNTFKKSGILKYKEYDFEGSIEDFKKALQVNYKDVAVHFNLSCAYSIMEEVENALFHLDKAVEYGFVDFNKIKDHNAFAFLRIQPEFESFSKNGYRLRVQTETVQTLGNIEHTNGKKEAPMVQKETPSVDLLEQLRKLGELKEKGLLTEEEFQIQKTKLLK